MSRDYPSNTVNCYAADTVLWKIFEEAYKNRTGQEPSYDWTEAEVHQWLDIEWVPVFEPTLSDKLKYYDV